MKFLLLILFCFSSIAGSAQGMPFNPKLIYGKLDNGLTYYIQKNINPKDRAMFYLVVNAGAIDEEENQNGLAHFCEHMAFNGTKNLPGKMLMNYMEQNGVSFGEGINAFTGPITTCYALNNVPTTRESLVDSSLMILHEWAVNVTFDTDEINKERRVIHEEWRTRGGAERRMSDITNKVLYNNSKYSWHNVIGTLDVIDQSDPELVRKFYKDFYRPDLQAVIVVGDINEANVKAKIRQLFGSDPKRINPVVTPKIMVPDNKELLIGFATDKEAQNIEINLYSKFPDPPSKGLDFLESGMLNSLYNLMFSERYNEMLMKENPPMIGAFSGFDGFTKYQSSYRISIDALNNDPLGSLKAVMIENERVKRYGFTASELERAKKQALITYDQSYSERDRVPSSSLVENYINHFSEEIPTLGIVYAVQLAHSYIPSVTLEKVNALAQKWITDENRVMTIHGPEGIKLPTEQEIRNTLAEIQARTIEPYKDKEIAAKLISKELKGSPLVKDESVKEIGGSRFILKNGATVYFKTTDNMHDEVLFQAFSKGGVSLLPNEDVPSAIIAGGVSALCGFGDFSSQDLKRYLAGKVANVNTSLTELEEIISGNAKTGDMETLLQMIYLTFTSPRRDDPAMKSMIERSKMVLQNRKSDPNSALSDTLIRIMTNYNPRVMLMTPEYFDKIDINKAYTISADRFKDASDFTFLFVGDIDADKMKPLIEKYIGSIPSIHRKENWKDLKIRPKNGRTEREITVEMKDPKAVVFVHYFGEYPYVPENIEYLNAIRYVLTMRFNALFREKEGGTYGVNVIVSLNSRPVNSYEISMDFTCSPDKADYLKGLLYAEIKNLKENGVTDAELIKTKENFLKESYEKIRSNAYIMDRVKNYITDGVYTPLPQYSTEIYNHLDANRIKKLANEVFKEDVVELVMKPEIRKGTVAK